MTTQTITDIRRVGGRLGAEVLGIDLREDLSDEVFAEINEALLQHKLLAFRGQELTDEDQLRFVERFGPLTGAHPTLPPLDGKPSVLPVRGEGTRANNWHTDVTFLVTPPKLSTLRALTVAPYGGDTLVADTASAYDDLPRPLRDLADALWAVHTNDYDYVQPGDFENELVALEAEQFVSRVYETAHPVVRVHPETGRRNLFIGGFAQKLIGLSNTESRDILRLLQAYVIRPENTVRWRWAPGDLILFDNRTTQHYAPDDYGDLARELHRVTGAGDVPVGIDGKRSYAISGDDASHYTPVPV